MLERICSVCGGLAPVSPGIHDATNARRLSDSDEAVRFSNAAPDRREDDFNMCILSDDNGRS